MSNQGKGKSIWKNYRFPILLIGSIVVSSVIGMVMGEKATVLKPFGDIFLNLMFTAIVPLVFATIASAVGNMMNMKRLGSILGNMFLVFVITGIIAGIVITLLRYVLLLRAWTLQWKLQEIWKQLNCQMQL